jgi:hypothetical protein
VKGVAHIKGIAVLSALGFLRESFGAAAADTVFAELPPEARPDHLLPRDLLAPRDLSALTIAQRAWPGRSLPRMRGRSGA